MRRALMWLGLAEDPDNPHPVPWYITVPITMVAMAAGALVIRSFWGLAAGSVLGSVLIAVITTVIERRSRADRER